MTRPELPDISQPLEILSEDLRPEQAKNAAPGLSLQDEAPAPEARPASSRREPAGTPAAEEPLAAERASARKVFEAKYKEPNPRLPFYITMGVLGVFALGTVGYFWVQLRPAPPLVNANPPRPTGEKPVDVAALKPAAAAAQAPADEPWRFEVERLLSRWSDFLTTDGEKATRDRDAEFVARAERGLGDLAKASLLAEKKGKGEVSVTTVGRKGNEFLRGRGVTIRKDWPGQLQRLSFAGAEAIALELAQRFLSGEVDAVHLMYNEFASAVSQVPTTAQLLPFEAKAASGDTSAEYEYEPGAGAVSVTTGGVVSGAEEVVKVRSPETAVLPAASLLMTR